MQPAQSSSPSSTIPEIKRVEPVDLSVIIVNYNVRDFLEQALRSVYRATKSLSVEVFVVDNNSADDSLEMVRELFPQTAILANEENVGFGIANNQAIRVATGRYLLILNPDTIVGEDTLVEMVRFMDGHPDCGAAGCRILNPDGTFAPESRRAFPTPAVALPKVLGLSKLFPKSRHMARYNMTYLPQDEVAEVDALSGSCMFVRRAALSYTREELAERKVPRTGWLQEGSGPGGFDEDFFMYGEDLDWCFRIQRAGWRIYYNPATSIIHYKGESTKKGELRYVRLFYGAMIQFTKKHFQSRYSAAFAGLLHLAIIGRGALTLAGTYAGRAAWPALDFLLMYGAIALLAWGRSTLNDDPVAPLLLFGVAPGYALAATLSITMAGGYRYAWRKRLRPVIVGATAAFLIIAAVSFFIREIGYSRAVILGGYPLLILLPALRRLITRSTALPRKAVLVGNAYEADRLNAMLLVHPKPPFTLIGYVEADRRRQKQGGVIKRIGHIRHLRDLVRLQQINDVVFSSGTMTNQVIFEQMQLLGDLPVQFRMFAEGGTQVIGKASVDDLALPSLLEAESAIAPHRSAAARRVFELTFATAVLLLSPMIFLAGKLGSTSASRLLGRMPRLLQLFRGKLALVGYDLQQPKPPTTYGMRPGVFSVTEVLSSSEPTPEETSSACWFYVTHQSAAFDWELIMRALTRR